MEIAQLLHDNLFLRAGSRAGCTRRQSAHPRSDVLTRNLPLHLSLACGEEINVPGVDTQGANFLCEVMPIEYAPCVQAVAASQVYQRPKRIDRIAAFADPAGDLTVARVAMEEFGAHSGDPGRFFLKSGADVTKAAVTKEVTPPTSSCSRRMASSRQARSKRVDSCCTTSHGAWPTWRGSESSRNAR